LPLGGATLGVWNDSILYERLDRPPVCGDKNDDRLPAETPLLVMARENAIGTASAQQQARLPWNRICASPY